MPNTFIQAHWHVVFAVKYRRALIQASWKERLHQYMIGIIHNHSHRVLALNSMPDHVHILFGYNTNQTLPDLMLHVKRDSTLWINKNRLTKERFAWQEGYGGFAVCKGHLSPVIAYILNQEQHHRAQSFPQEFSTFLEREELAYDPRYLFHNPL